LARIRRTRLGTTNQPPSACAAARGCWPAHPEAGDGPAQPPPPQADGAAALLRERPAPGQPPAAAQADGAEWDAVLREHPATGAARPPVVAQADGAGPRSREHPATEAAQPPVVAQAGGAEALSREQLATGAGQPPVVARADEVEALSREQPATGTPPVTGQPPAAFRVDGAETLLPEWSAVGPPRAAAQTGGPGAAVVSWERPATGTLPVSPPAPSQADGSEPEVVPWKRPATRAHPAPGPPPVGRAAVVLPDEPRAASEARVAERDRVEGARFCSAREPDGPAPHRRRAVAAPRRCAGPASEFPAVLRSSVPLRGLTPVVRRAAGAWRPPLASGSPPEAGRHGWPWARSSRPSR
jgi:hypothetical protein